jgi:L-asparaginase
MKQKLIIHGGFSGESDVTQKKPKQKALAKVAKAAFDHLQSRSALDTVVLGVRLLEDCELFNAGYGSRFQRDGRIRLTASLMDGATKRFSGVINIQEIKNPILLAQELLGHEDCVLSGDEALAFARNIGMKYFNPETPTRRKEYERGLEEVKTGTVGCVALDKNGHIAAATSTGGKGFENPGRVSDVGTVACTYANEFAGVSCTGIGEDIVRMSLAARIVTRVSDGFSLEEACKKSFIDLKSIDGFAGVIAINCDGNIYHMDSHPFMLYALYDDVLEVFD